MAANPLFAVGEFSGPLGGQQFNREWDALAANLANYGPQKTVDQWKHTWRDLKKRAREEGSRVRQARNATGNNIPIPKTSDQTQTILDTIGHECASGIASGEETGLGSPANIIILPEIEFEEILIDQDCSSVQSQAGSSSGILPQHNTAPLQSRLVLPQPSTTVTTSSRPRRSTARSSSKINNASLFIRAQEQTNTSLEHLSKELKRSNDLRTQQLSILQVIADRLERSVPL